MMNFLPRYQGRKANFSSRASSPKLHQAANTLATPLKYGLKKRPTKHFISEHSNQDEGRADKMSTSGEAPKPADIPGEGGSSSAASKDVDDTNLRPRIELCEYLENESLFNAVPNSLKVKYNQEQKKQEEPTLNRTAQALLDTINWLRTAEPFINLPPSYQQALVLNSWRELFIVTSAQHPFFFAEEVISEDDLNHRSQILEEVDVMIDIILDYIVNLIRELSLDCEEYEFLKLLIIFRSDDMDETSSIAKAVNKERSRVLKEMRTYCRTKGQNRYRDILALIPSIFKTVSKGLLRYVLYSKATDEAITHILVQKLSSELHIL